MIPRAYGSRGLALAGIFSAVLLGLPAARAAAVHDLPTAPGSGIAIRISTPLKFAPHFGFIPVRIEVDNKSAADGTWQVSVTSGDATVFPGLVRAGFEVAAAAGTRKEQWIFAPLAAPGVVATPVYDPDAVIPPVLFPPGASAASATPAVAPTMSARQLEALGKAANAVLEPTGLLDIPWGVTMAVTNLNGVVTFEQTGDAAALGKPSAASLPPGVMVNLHPAPLSGQVVRTVTYVSPADLEALDAPPTSRVDAYRRAVNRNTMGLWRYGFLRKSASIQATAPSSFADPDGVVTTSVSETGPSTLLAQPPPEALPPDTVVTVVPGQVPPGGVVRRFTVTTLVPAAASDPQNARPFSAVLGAAEPGVILASVAGPGLERAIWTDLSSGLEGDVEPMPPVAVPPQLEDTVRGRLALGNLRAPPTVTPVEVSALPADWRIWSSMHAVLLGAGDFSKLDAERRSALRRWVALGGRLVLSTDNEDSAPLQRVGAGEISTLSGSLGYVPPGTMSRHLQLATPVVGLPERASLARDHASVESLGAGERSDTRWLIFVLVGFAIVAGPVNILVFAPPSRRHRIIASMPLIALAGALIMGGGVVVRVGLGGEGIRSTVVALVPEENGAAVFQDQVSRTGVLLSRKFELPADTLLAAAPLDAESTQALQTVLERTGDAAGGDWFRSRAWQAYHLRRFAPVSGLVEVVSIGADGAPTVKSSLSGTLTDFGWVDDKERIWTAASVAPGAAVTLAPAAAGAGWPLLRPRGSRQLGKAFAAAAAKEPGRWAARGSSADGLAIPTLASIRWKESDVLIAGSAISKTWAQGPTEGSATP